MHRLIKLLLLSFLIITGCFGQNSKVDSLFNKFQQSSFYEDVYPSKLRLEDYQAQIIPRLIKLLDDTNFVKLTNTFDLIYPGATKFYGHGHFVPYDMDWISVRSGWLLEELTFQDFGYKTSGVNDSTLFNLMKENYGKYLKKGTYDLEWKNKSPREKLIEYRKILASKAKLWWQENEDTWTRLSAIKEALQSKDENRLGEVLQFLRYGKTKCDGLNENVYEIQIKPLILDLQNTKFTDIKKQVDLLLSEGLTYWIAKMNELEKNSK
jgi:hypothetical protein